MRQILFLAILGLAALSVSAFKQVEQQQLGTVIFSEDMENRTVVGVVRINKELLRHLSAMARAGSNRYVAAGVEERHRAFSELVDLVEQGCARLDNNRPLRGNEKEIPITKYVEDVVISQEGEPGVKVDKAVELYRTVFNDLLQRPSTFADLKSRALEKSLNNMAHNVSKKSVGRFIERLTSFRGVGCADSDTLLVNITFFYVPASERKRHKLTEVMDYGQFLKNGEIFVRSEIAKKWLRGKHWESLDFDKCSSLDAGYWACPRSAATRAEGCNPDDVFQGCRPSVTCVKSEGFVHHDKTADDRVVLATLLKTYRLMRRNGTWSDEAMPESGVVLLSIPVGEQVVVGRVTDSQTILEGTRRVEAFSATPVVPSVQSFNASLFSCDGEQPVKYVYAREDHGPAALVEDERMAELEELTNQTRWGLAVVMLMLAITLIAVAVAGYFYRQPIVIFATNAFDTLKKQPAPAADTDAPRSPRTTIYNKMSPFLPFVKSRTQTGTELATHAGEDALQGVAVEAAKPLVESAVDEESASKQ